MLKIGSVRRPEQTVIVPGVTTTIASATTTATPSNLPYSVKRGDRTVIQENGRLFQQLFR
jgi:hypothetical protein